MNSLKNFIDCGTECPVCGKQLTLFMVVDGPVCFRAYKEPTNDLNSYFGFTTRISEQSPLDNWFKFVPTYSKKKDFSQFGTYGKSHKIEENEIILMNIRPDETVDILYNADNCYNIVNKKTVHFFSICDTSAIKDHVSDFSIDVYKACYYRSTSKMTLSDSTLTPVDESSKSAVKTEVVSIHKDYEGFEKTYILSMDLTTKKTKFFYFKITDEDKKEKKVRPKVLEKEFDLLVKRPDLSLESRDKLINKFESWVLLS